MSTSGVSRTEAQAKRSRKTPAERSAELVDAAALVFLKKDTRRRPWRTSPAGQPAVDRIRDILKVNSEPELTGWWVEELSRSYMTHL